MTSRARLHKKPATMPGRAAESEKATERLRRSEFPPADLPSHRAPQPRRQTARSATGLSGSGAQLVAEWACAGNATRSVRATSRVFPDGTSALAGRFHYLQ